MKRNEQQIISIYPLADYPNGYPLFAGDPARRALYAIKIHASIFGQSVTMYVTCCRNGKYHFSHNYADAKLYRFETARHHIDAIRAIYNQ